MRAGAQLGQVPSRWSASTDPNPPATRRKLIMIQLPSRHLAGMMRCGANAAGMKGRSQTTLAKAHPYWYTYCVAETWGRNSSNPGAVVELLGLLYSRWPRTSKVRELTGRGRYLSRSCRVEHWAVTCDKL